MNNSFKWLLTALLIGIWTLVFEFINRTVSIKISLAKLNDTKNRIVSILHGLLAFWLCTITLLIKPNLLGKTNSHTVNIILMISLSYFVYDTVACIYYKLIDRSMLLHHIVCITALALCLMGFKGSFYLIVGLSVAEISNFPMHLRTILRNIGLKYTKLYQLCQSLYFFLYTIARGLISPLFLLVPAMMDHKVSFGLKGLVLVIHLQSFYFIFEMLEIIRKNRKKTEEMEQKQIQYDWFTQNPEKLRELSFFRLEEQ